MDCDQCPSPSCLIPEFTPECTNECLVVACDDPEHGARTCQVIDGSNPCDGSCIAAAACSDCTGIEEILQCCTDYHSYLAPSPHWYPPPCDCSHPVLSEPSMSSSASSSPSLSPFSPNLLPISPFQIQPSLTQPFNCMWANCRAVFNSLDALVGHVNLEHLCPIDPQNISLPVQSQDLSLSCHWGDCAMSSVPSTSASSDDHILNILTTHLMQDHLGVNYPFPPSSSLQSQEISDTTHVPSASSDLQLHDCSGIHVCKWKECSQTFPSCDDLTAHIATVHIGSGRAHYDCFWQGCDRNGDHGFPSKQKISRHMQSHTGHRPFQCQICNQNFSEAATLQQHMRRHTQEKPYVCDFPGCRKAFATTGALTIHKRIHNGLRPFKCKFCDRAFSESSNLTKHLRTHTGARPYTCTEQGCEKAFARPDQLARHMNVHRKKNPKG